MDGSNRHAVDRLADVRLRLKELEREEASLRAYVLQHPDDRVGNARGDYLPAIPQAPRSRRPAT
jgi:hypothetical protein